MNQTVSRSSAAESSAPGWSRTWLRAAGIYNVVWGAVVIAFPGLFFHWAGMEPLNYPQIWQCVGMIVGVYGVGYWIAARDSRRHWPIVLVGLLGKIFGPIGFAKALIDGSFPPGFGVNIIFNDLIWWVPFGMMLWDAAKSRGEPPALGPGEASPLDELRDGSGRSVRELSGEGPMLVVFVRHAGCTFCREALAELERVGPRLGERGVKLGIVTMSSGERNGELAASFGLTGATWFSDPDRVAYRGMELERGTFWQLFGARVWWPGVRATLRGHLVGGVEGDGFQMPGAFLVHRGRVVRAFRHAHAADRPDYVELACEVSA